MQMLVCVLQNLASFCITLKARKLCVKYALTGISGIHSAGAPLRTSWEYLRPPLKTLPPHSRRVLQVCGQVSLQLPGGLLFTPWAGFFCVEPLQKFVPAASGKPKNLTWCRKLTELRIPTVCTAASVNALIGFCVVFLVFYPCDNQKHESTRTTQGVN